MAVRDGYNNQIIHLKRGDRVVIECGMVDLKLYDDTQEKAEARYNAMKPYFADLQFSGPVSPYYDPVDGWVSMFTVDIDKVSFDVKHI